MNDDQKIFVGVVSSSDAITYSVQIDTFGSTHKSPMMAIPLAGVFASTFGFKECPQYSVGSTVLCYRASYDMCYIIGIIPASDYANLQFPARACLKTADGNYDAQNIQGYNSQSTKKATFNQQRPTDVVEGEYVVTNEFGVLLGLFQHLATLKASELAQIQCFLLDDLVRVVSHNYEHLTALGEFKIVHDGNALMAEFGATHDPREGMGVAQVEEERDEPVFEEEGPPENGGTDEKDFYKFTNDERQKGIERLKIFLGKLGDFVHMFLVRPDPEAVRALNGELGGGYDKGMADVHVALDGRISVRTVTGMAIEKTNWIMVPHRVRTAEDPKGDEDITFDTKDPFKFDDSKKIRENPALYFLQMRDCNAYLQDLYNYKNFQQYKKDIKLSNDPEEEDKLSEIEKVDPKTPVSLNNYQMRKSGVYLMDNGGVMIMSAMGSALILEEDIYIQAARDTIAQPMRNYIVKAGQFVSVAAKKDVDISSSEEGFRLKTEKVQHFYSDKQGIILESNAINPAEPSPEDKAYTQFGGVLLKAENSGIFSFGKTIFDRATERALYKADMLMLESVDQLLGLKSGGMLNLSAKTNLMLTTEGTVQILSTGALMAVSQSAAIFAGTSTSIGNKGSVIGMVPHPGSLPAIMDGVIPVGDFPPNDPLASINFQKTMSPFDNDGKFTKTKFRFLASTEYHLDATADFLPQTIAQQNDEAFNTLNLVEWEEAEVNDTLPFPGKDKFESYYVTCVLKNLQKIDNDICSKASQSLTSSGGTLTSKSLKQYKVQP